MTIEHTPGPWKATVDPDGNNLHVQSAQDIFVVGGCGCCGSPFTDKNCAEANARLIAAAPELLEALEKVAPLLDYLPHPHCVEAIDVVRNALAKARGEA